MKLLIFLARILLGAVFVFSGFVKAVDPLGTVYKIEDYLKAFGGFFTDLLPLAGTAAVLLIATEWILGVCMICNVRTKVTSWIALAFLSCYDPADALDRADESRERLRLFRGRVGADQLADVLEERGVPLSRHHPVDLQESHSATMELVDGDSTRRARSRIRSRYHGI